MAISPEAIGAWSKLFQGAQEFGAKRPYLQDIAEAQRDINVGQAGITGASAQFAPQLFGSQAQQAENQAGISGINLQYAPQMAQQQLQSGGLANQINQLKLQQIQNAMSSPSFQGTGPLAQLIQGREDTRTFYGEGSPELEMYDRLMEQKLQGKEGIVVHGAEGQPLVSIGGTGGRGGQPLMASQGTGEIFAPLTPAAQTQAQQSLQGITNVTDFLEDVIKYMPQFQSPYTQGLERAQTLANRWISPITGIDFPLPAEKAEGEAAIKKSVEGYMSAYNLPKAEISIDLVESVFSPTEGETENQYRKRMMKEHAHLMKAGSAIQQAIAQGHKVGKITSKSELDKWAQKFEPGTVGKAQQQNVESLTKPRRRINSMGVLENVQ